MFCFYNTYVYLNIVNFIIIHYYIFLVFFSKRKKLISQITTFKNYVYACVYVECIYQIDSKWYATMKKCLILLIILQNIVK